MTHHVNRISHTLNESTGRTESVKRASEKVHRQCIHCAQCNLIAQPRTRMLWLLLLFMRSRDKQNSHLAFPILRANFWTNIARAHGTRETSYIAKLLICFKSNYNNSLCRLVRSQLIKCTQRKHTANSNWPKFCSSSEKDKYLYVQKITTANRRITVFFSPSPVTQSIDFGATTVAEKKVCNMNSTSPKSSLAKIGLHSKPKPFRILILGTTGVGKTGVITIQYFCMLSLFSHPNGNSKLKKFPIFQNEIKLNGKKIVVICIENKLQNIEHVSNAIDSCLLAPILRSKY